MHIKFDVLTIHVMPEKQRSNPYRPDVTLFLIFIPFISAFNYYLTYSNIKVSWFLLLTFTIDTFQVTRHGGQFA
ncbi:MAG: hypothetical protein ACOYXT_15820 [Bacteroidota bacterium]